MAVSSEGRRGAYVTDHWSPRLPKDTADAKLEIVSMKKKTASDLYFAVTVPYTCRCREEITEENASTTTSPFRGRCKGRR